MTREEIDQHIRQILQQDFRVPADQITPAATFRGSFHLDSLDVVDFILLLQKDFGYKAPMESYRELDSYGRLVDFVARTLAAQGGAS